MEFNRLYNQLDFLPEEVAKFVKNLKKDFNKTINHIKRKDIPKTNNLLEGFFKITFPKKYKRRFRTEKRSKKLPTTYDNTMVRTQCPARKNHNLKQQPIKY